MDKIKRFYCSYSQGCSYAVMECHGVFEASSWKDARWNWQDYMRYRNGKTYAVQPAYGPLPSAVFQIPKFMEDWPEEKILGHYREVSFTVQWVAPEDEIKLLAPPRHLWWKIRRFLNA